MFAVAASRPYISTLIVLAVFVAAGIAAALTAAGEDIWHQITALSLSQMAVLLLLSLCNYVFRAARWWLYGRAIGIPLRLIQVLRHYFGGFALTMTPGRVGELIRVRWMMRETGVAPERAAPLVLVDRAADLVVMALLLAISIVLFAGGLAGGWTVVGLALFVAMVATRPTLFRWAVTQLWRIVGRNPRFFARLRRAGLALRPFSVPAIALPAFVLGFAGWFAEGYAFYLLMDWMGHPLPLWTCVGIFIFSTMTGGATGMPGGLGGAEAAMVALLSLQGVPLEVSIPATAIIRITTLWFAIGLGLLVFPLAEAAAARGDHALERD